MKFASGLLFGGIVTALDIQSTYIYSNLMDEIEANPIQCAIMDEWGITVAMGFRCASCVFCIVCLLFLRRYRPKLAKLLLMLWCAQQFLVLCAIVDTRLLQSVWPFGEQWWNYFQLTKMIHLMFP